MTSRDRDYGRKYDSGSSKLKKSKKRKELEAKLSGSLKKYLKTDTIGEDKEQLCAQDSVEVTDVVRNTSISPSSEHPDPCVQDTTAAEAPVTVAAAAESLCFHTETSLENEEVLYPADLDLQEESSTILTNLNVSDPFLWPNQLSDLEITNIVQKGPVRVYKKFYPKNESGRHFSNTYFIKTLINGEEQDRRWLVYSEAKDAVYCFACRLFSVRPTTNSALGSNEGMSDWKHLSEALKSHENSKSHKECMIKWLNLKKGMSCGKTIDSHTQNQIRAEQQRWRDILERLLAIVQFLATHNLAFRGHEEKLHLNSSGNFLDLVKLIARFDPTLREHLNQTLNKAVARNHYLSKNIQNEFIEVMANHVKTKIVDKVLKNKYYAIILDCTRDIARIEQLSIILRITNQDTAEIEEHFLEFVAVENTTGEKLADYVINKLQDLGLSLVNCRGQGYDNGANMRGEKSGVQRRLLNINPLAFFVPCGSHSWNLVLGDAASSCVQAQTFFGVLQRLYTVFSCSCERWSILKSYVKISLKPLSETRWECRSESVKAVRYQLSQICDALSFLRESSTDCGLVSECQSLENEITTYEFVVSLVVWYDILVKIHTISKVWQNINMHIDVAVKHLETFINWLDEYRLSGSNSALVTAREVAEEAGIDRTFKSFRRRRKKKMFIYEKEDEAPELSPEDNFKINYFLVIVDAVRMSCKPRFASLKIYENSFGFMYHIKELGNMSDEDLMKNCKDLQTTLSDGDDQHDIDAVELYEELKMLALVYHEDQDDVLSVLKYIVQNSLKDVYPNVFVTLRIIGTIPVTVASAERSFSKLKLIKTYLRNSMTQDRLSSLALLSIESELATTLDYSDVIEDFSRKKSRRVVF